MTKALKKVIAQLDKMSLSERKAIAILLNEEMAWQKSINYSQDKLKLLAFEALSKLQQADLL